MSSRELVTVPDVARVSMASPRQIHYWIGRGWLQSTRPNGSWDLMLDPTEADVARVMIRLINVGFQVSYAAALARLVVTGQNTEIDLGYGITMIYPDRKDN